MQGNNTNMNTQWLICLDIFFMAQAHTSDWLWDWGLYGVSVVMDGMDTGWMDFIIYTVATTTAQKHVLKMTHDKIGGAGSGSKRRRSGNGNGCNKTLPAVFNSHAR